MCHPTQSPQTALHFTLQSPQTSPHFTLQSPQTSPHFTLQSPQTASHFTLHRVHRLPHISPYTEYRDCFTEYYQRGPSNDPQEVMSALKVRKPTSSPSLNSLSSFPQNQRNMKGQWRPTEERSHGGYTLYIGSTTLLRAAWGYYSILH